MQCRITTRIGPGDPRKPISKFAAHLTPGSPIRARCAVLWLENDPEVEAERERYRRSQPKPNGHDPSEGAALEDFYAYMPMHNYIYVPTRTTWPGSSVNSRIEPIKLTDKTGRPV